VDTAVYSNLRALRLVGNRKIDKPVLMPYPIKTGDNWWSIPMDVRVAHAWSIVADGATPVIPESLRGAVDDASAPAPKRQRRAASEGDCDASLLDAVGLRYTQLKMAAKGSLDVWAHLVECVHCGQAHGQAHLVSLSPTGAIRVYKYEGACKEMPTFYPKIVNAEALGGPVFRLLSGKANPGDEVRVFNPHQTGLNMNPIATELWMSPVERTDYRGPTPWLDILTMLFEPDEIVFMSEFLGGWSFRAPRATCPLCAEVHGTGLYVYATGEGLRCPSGGAKAAPAAMVTGPFFRMMRGQHGYPDTEIRVFEGEGPVPTAMWMKPVDRSDYYGPTPWADVIKMPFELEEIEFESEHNTGWSFRAPRARCPLCSRIHATGLYVYATGEGLRCPDGDGKGCKLADTAIDVGPLVAATSWNEKTAIFTRIARDNGNPGFNSRGGLVLIEIGMNPTLYCVRLARGNKEFVDRIRRVHQVSAPFKAMKPSAARIAAERVASAGGPVANID
jgi:hypothetical protein